MEENDKLGYLFISYRKRINDSPETPTQFWPPPCISFYSSYATLKLMNQCSDVLGPGIHGVSEEFATDDQIFCLPAVDVVV